MPIFAVYKPKGPSSYDIIRQIKKATGEKKVGHAGTLDPLAKGILVIGVGREATKQLGKIAGGEKEYLATIYLGATSSTDDAEGPITKLKIKNEKLKIKESLRDIILKFTGKIRQTPPIFSAIKINGQRAYKLARQLPRSDLDNLKLKPRPVEIKSIKITGYKWPYLKLKVVTGPGVYIRSLARDIGAKVGTGGYLYNLERTRVGKFAKKDAVRLSSPRKRGSSRSSS